MTDGVIASRGGVLLVLSAPTGGGKTTIAHRLIAEDGQIRFSVSHTTRTPRPGERDGVDYHFISREDFMAKAGRGEFLEWAEVHDHFYGTHRSERAGAAAAGKDLLLDIDVQGGLQVRTAEPSVVLVFILPPSLEVLLRRLENRAGEPGFDLARRLESALKELELAERYDYNVVNEDLDEAVRQVRSILGAARLRATVSEDTNHALKQEITDWLRRRDVHR